MLRVIRERLTMRAATLGWRLGEPTLDGAHLVVDGVVIEPDVSEKAARFIVPATAREIWIASVASEPGSLEGHTDRCQPGLTVRGISIDDGLLVRMEIPAADDRLAEGFHPVETCGEEGFRWTDGLARVPQEFWAGCQGQFFLRVDLFATGAHRWVFGEETATSAPALKLVRAARSRCIMRPACPGIDCGSDCLLRLSERSIDPMAIERQRSALLNM